MKTLLLFISTLFFSLHMTAQTGISTDSPLSTLHNAGSFAGNYVVNPGQTYTLGDDYIVDFTNNQANVIYTLPSISPGTATNRNGRMYIIRNGSTTNSLTIKGSGTETINSASGNSNTYLLAPGKSAMVVRNANASGTSNTWNIVSLGNVAPSSRTYHRTIKTTNGTPLPLVASNNNDNTAITFNTTGNSKNLFDNNIVLTEPKRVRFTFTAGIDDSGSDTTSRPYIYYYMEVFSTDSGLPLRASGHDTQLSIQIQMIAGQDASFTFVDELNMNPGSYNARLKCYYGVNSGNLKLGFVSYSIVASYEN